MKLTFIFRDSVDSSNEVTTALDLPSGANTPDGRTHMLELANGVGMLTEAVLLVRCREAAIIDQPVKLTKTTAWPVQSVFHRTVLLFERRIHRPLKGQKTAVKLLIVEPVSSPFRFFPAKSPGRGKPYPLNVQHPKGLKPQDDVQRGYLDTISRLADHCLALLNADTTTNEREEAWTFTGFQPYWKDKSAVDKFAKGQQKREVERKAEQRRLAREERRRAQQGVMSTTAGVTGEPRREPTTGAGRRPGAIPGVFKEVKMRSQLEIRFAAHLEERKIRWIYEGERLGDEQYLVDFYLPDRRCWVEVKGKFEPRDNFQLPGVANYLAQERTEHLYVYTQSRAYRFYATGRMKTLTHEEFWTELDI